MAQKAGVSDNMFCEGVATFQKPPHRLEKVRVLRGITYVNDSKATNVDAVKKAVQAFKRDVVLIVGGMDKGGDFQEWIPIFLKKVVHVLAMGEAANRIHEEIGRVIPVEMVDSLEESVKRASMLAKKNQTVLLSPGCSSYDQFKDYQHRGESFKQLVFAIEENLS